ncbi:hypothetical protein L1887_56417 [Cichorium endivia]|nr:hypothetical protein L1887_56417 [Cichorium endivia]
MVANSLDCLYTWTWIADTFAGMRPLSVQIAAANRNTLRLNPGDEFVWARTQQRRRHRLQPPHGKPSHIPPALLWAAWCSAPLPTTPRLAGRRANAPSAAKASGTGDSPPRPRSCASSTSSACSRTWTMRGLALHGIRPIVQEAHYLLEHDAEASQLLDSCLLTNFFDIAVLADLEHCISSFHPYSKAMGRGRAGRRPLRARGAELGLHH